MYIFVDEAGTFHVPQRKQMCAVSCVGALGIPEDDIEDIYSGFIKLKTSWGNSNGEIKGSKLDEYQINSLIAFLKNFDVVFEVTAIDMALQSIKGIIEHRRIQAEKFTENLTDKHKPSLVNQCYETKEQIIKNFSIPLYVQARCTFNLLYNIIQQVTLYYSLRKPKELGAFYWIIDAKDIKKTPYEELWTKIVLPLLQDRSLHEPFITFNQADYSFFKKFFLTFEKTPEHLQQAVGIIEPFETIEINDIYRENLSFKCSHDVLGVQLADILTTTMRRAMNGNLKIQGWQGIGQLMLQSKTQRNTIELIDLCRQERSKHSGAKPPYYKVIPFIDRTCKPMLKKC